MDIFFLVRVIFEFHSGHNQYTVRANDKMSMLTDHVDHVTRQSMSIGENGARPLC